MILLKIKKIIENNYKFSKILFSICDKLGHTSYLVE